MKLPLDERAAVVAAMKDVTIHGNSVAHHLRGEIFEVIARAKRRQYRILYSTEGKSDHILLAVHAIVKKTPSVPGRDIALAEQRVSDWRSRSRTP
ncbi:MAG: type II toxin-antitoxin system RelE/ParE family toxin [Actinomycetota bacterium]|nr:type II toxin-antitoxin system RelE/ParE family toxin [Actinomycetota bacterium]MEA3511801.1 type II toxin-antitoxin system RelE/ParE family toxin [Actinomycetota bacterium]